MKFIEKPSDYRTTECRMVQRYISDVAMEAGVPPIYYAMIFSLGICHTKSANQPIHQIRYATDHLGIHYTTVTKALKNADKN